MIINALNHGPFPRSSLNGLCLVMVIVFAQMPFTGCDRKSTSSDATSTQDHSSAQSKDPAQVATSIQPRDAAHALPPSGVLIGRILRVTEGELVDGHRTVVIVADKGSADGVTRNMLGYVSILPGTAIESLHVDGITLQTTILSGWQYDAIKPGIQVIIADPQVDSRSVERLLNPVRSQGQRSASKADDAFTSFMKQYYVAFKAQNWAKMTTLASQETERAQYFEKLITVAGAVARSQFRDMRYDWSGTDFLTSYDLVGLAVCIVTPPSNGNSQKSAGLSASQRGNVLAVFNDLFQRAMLVIGSDDDATPQINGPEWHEARDKLLEAYAVAELVGDIEALMVAKQGAAWFIARVGSADQFSRMGPVGRNPSLPWPPIIKEGHDYKYLRLEAGLLAPKASH